MLWNISNFIEITVSIKHLSINISNSKSIRLLLHISYDWINENLKWMVLCIIKTKLWYVNIANKNCYLIWSKALFYFLWKREVFLFSTYILNVCINNFVKITALLHYLKCHFYPSAINYTRDGLNIRDLSFLTIYRGWIKLVFIYNIVFIYKLLAGVVVLV